MALATTCAAAGLVAYWLRCWFRLQYGLGELVIGGSIFWAVVHYGADVLQTNGLLTAWVPLAMYLFLIVRGLDNFHGGLRRGSELRGVLDEMFLRD